MSRHWVPIDEDREDFDEWIDKVRAECDALAVQWSFLTKKAEREHFERLSDYENGFNDRDYDPEDEEFYRFCDAQEKLKRDLERIQVEHIEERLHELGARMMRPYEHWNEEERYMEYMERER